MAVLGIVAEFNPFHNGHLNLIREVKSNYNFKAIVCVMSGSFTQRGEPAVCNKWSRAEMALRGGADLVIELPFCFATRSAYYFARGAIELLELTGVITHLAFGSESNDITILNKISTLLNNEPDDYKLSLKEFLNQGLSYPVARSKSLQKHLKNPSIDSVLLGSNNILGIEYLRVLEELNSNIIPLTIKRQGASYHSIDLVNYASASAIRHALNTGKSLDEIHNTMPLSTKEILLREIEQGRAPINKNDYNNAILTRLRTVDEKQISELYDVIEGLESRIVDKAITSTNIDQLTQAIKSKRYSFTRINRILLYSLFNLTKNLVDELDSSGPMYHHVLGFTDNGIKLLQEINQYSKIPVLNRGKDVKTIYDKKDTPEGKMINLDVMSTNVYNLLYPNLSQRTGATDFTTSPVRYL